LLITFNRLQFNYIFWQKPRKSLCQKRTDFFSKKFSTPNSPNLPDFPCLNIPDFPDCPNFPIQPNKKTDISFSTGIIQKISAFDSLLKIGFLFFLFSVRSY